jgi:transcriptional regulator with XRE-family HTH domain
MWSNADGFPNHELNDEERTVITLAQRVRDFRYSKGWGPDELASRAEISRTALYQIESGKTSLPRAGTLRRIAVALDVSMDELLGNAEPTAHLAMRSARDQQHPTSRGRDLSDWMPSEGGPLTLPSSSSHPGSLAHIGVLEEPKREDRFGVETQRRNSSTSSSESLLMREGELMSRLHDLLHSPMGAGIARIVDDLHVLVGKHRNSP